MIINIPLLVKHMKTFLVFFFLLTLSNIALAFNESHLKKLLETNACINCDLEAANPSIELDTKSNSSEKTEYLNNL